ncbi:hypothetical protein SRHO_G00075170 [Serrasalmus rhombeus]
MQEEADADAVKVEAAVVDPSCIAPRERGRSAVVLILHCHLQDSGSLRCALCTEAELQTSVITELSVKAMWCYNCGGLDHHAKECGLPPQPKKCHYCQSVMHMVAQCPHKGALSPSTSQDPPPLLRGLHAVTGGEQPLGLVPPRGPVVLSGGSVSARRSRPAMEKNSRLTASSPLNFLTFHLILREPGSSTVYLTRSSNRGGPLFPRSYGNGPRTSKKIFLEFDFGANSRLRPAALLLRL